MSNPFVFADLVLDTGGIVRIECPSEHEDALFDSISNSMRRSDWWSPLQFDGCKAELNGMLMDRISMKRVVGMLR